VPRVIVFETEFIHYTLLIKTVENTVHDLTSCL